MFLGQEVHYYMVYIAYFTGLILQICNYAQKRRIWRENCKYALDENFHCHFCSRRKAAKLCHPVHDYIDYDDYNNYNVYRDSDLDLDLDYLLIIFIYWTQWYMI